MSPRISEIDPPSPPPVEPDFEEQIKTVNSAPPANSLPNQDEILRKVFLESTTDDMSKDQEKRRYAQEQVRKYLNTFSEIESQTFSDHVSDIYVYEDGEVQKEKETNFYSRVFEESLRSSSVTTMPFYYLENTIEKDGVKRNLSDIPEYPPENAGDNYITLQDFYRRWNLRNQVTRNKIFFSDTPELNKLFHFPRVFEVNITIHPSSFNGINSKITTPESAMVYDKMCLKYISALSDAVEGKKYILSSKNYLNTQTSQMFQIDNLIAKNPDGDYEDELLTIQDMLKIDPTSESKDVVDYEITAADNSSFYRMLYGSTAGVSNSIDKRDYAKIINGNSAPSEPFLYEIIKKDGNGRKINSFFFPARLYHSTDGTTTNLRFVDTQIKHKEEYQYSLKTHQIIYGEKYSFTEDLSYDQLAEGGADVDIGRAFTVVTDRDYRIASFETAEWSNKSISRPGISPDVKIIPQKNKRGMPKFFLKSNFGKTEIEELGFRYPVLSEQDRSTSEIIQNYANEDGTVTFESRFQNKFYEIYRIDKAPLTISDFNDSMIAKVLPSYSDDFGFGPTSVYEDSIQSNKKYYYLFRAVDVWGTPTAVTGPFEYEILEDSGAFTVNFKPYDFDYPLEKINMGMRKLMKVTPNWRHTRIPEESLSELESAFSQIENKSAVQYVMDEMSSDSNFWGKKYKIRVVSKKTGRKIDIIFTPRLTRS